ncbi:MAG: hypothetical protein MRERV_74c006 [Mycoplasmataceae bacterium RV_VA103A]|nr:MAG: hypothetical protein MRERV_74c006 [Mycoplasmataceae bacterium RV_VA103A]
MVKSMPLITKNFPFKFVPFLLLIIIFFSLA